MAVRVFTLGGAGSYADGTYPGGLYDDPVLKDADVRSGAWDAGATLNGRSYGYSPPPYTPPYTPSHGVSSPQHPQLPSDPPLIIDFKY